MEQKKIVIVDIDGTISKVGDRLKYLKQNPKDWDSFYEACGEDEANMPIIKLVKILQLEYDVVFCTGRRESVRHKTNHWLLDNLGWGVAGHHLLMRPNGDHGCDADVKPKLLKKAEIRKCDVAFILEDRNSMVKKWRELGFTCLQVADGDF